MIREKLTKYFSDRGFNRVNLGKEFMELFYVTRDNAVSLVWIVEKPDETEAGPEQFKAYAGKIRNSFSEKGFDNINLLTLFLTHDPSVARGFSSGEAFWVVDEAYGRLVIYDDMPEDFEGLRLPIEGLLSVTGFGVKSAPAQEEDKIKPEKRRKKGKRFEVNRKSYVMITFLVINVAVFLITNTFVSVLHTEKWEEIGMDNWWLVFHEHEYYRLLTGTFLHADISHLLGNMLGLVALGDVLEKVLGHIRFAVMYLLGGILASIGSCWYYMTQEEIDLNDLWRVLEPTGVKAKELAINATYCLGASGAIYALIGILAAYLLYNRNKPGAIDGTRIGIFLFYIFYTMVQGFREGSNIDNAAHVCGFFVGIALYYIIVALPAFVREKRKR